MRRRRASVLTADVAVAAATSRRWGRFSKEVPPGPPDTSDPFRLARFVPMHAAHFPVFLDDLRHGRRPAMFPVRWLFPAGPVFVRREAGGHRIDVAGRLVERVDPQHDCQLRDAPPNSHRGNDAALAFLRYPKNRDGVWLRGNYVAGLSAVDGVMGVARDKYYDSPMGLLGPAMFPIQQSAELFRAVAASGVDDEVFEVASRVVDRASRLWGLHDHVGSEYDLLPLSHLNALQRRAAEAAGVPSSPKL